MEPLHDSDFLAEASPRGRLMTGAEGLTEFCETTVRTMRYRSWIRWYHGPYSASGRSARVITNYLCAIAVLTCVYYVCDELSGEPMVRAAAGMALCTIIINCVSSQTYRFAATALLASYLCMAFGVVKLLLLGPVPSFDTVLLILVSLNAALALAALFMEYCALHFARMYTLKSRYFLATWKAQLVDTRRNTPFAKMSSFVHSRPSAPSNTKGSGYAVIKACPFDCEGRNFWWRRWFWIAWRYMRFGGRAAICEQANYLPPATIRTLCCAFCCVYSGEVDEFYRPHGLGVWSQGLGDEYGEQLSGCWEFGRPIAPFSSRQNTLGSGFTALRLGWVRFDFVTPSSKAQVYKNDRTVLDEDESLVAENFQFGLLDVECSIFGKFFRKFPKFTYWYWSREDQSCSSEKLGLNNRLSSFSWLEMENRIRRQRTPAFSENESCGGLDRDCSLGSTPFVENLLGRDACSSTRQFCRRGAKWVVKKLLPHHIPLSHGEDDAESNVHVYVDKYGELRPEGWIKTSDYADENALKISLSTRKRVRVVDRHESNASLLWATPKVSDAPQGLDLRIQGWLKPAAPSDLEAMVFIHGYKTPLNEAPLLMGQLIALGGFPNRIKPFMFLWPAGVKVWDYYVARRASHHYLCQRGLVLFLESLAHAGVKKIHILAHSMGSRLFLNSLKYATKAGLFVENYEKLVDESDRLNLVNLVFLHPEQYLDDFVLGGGYEATQKIATQTTIYTHSSDEALASAELLNRGRKCMGKHPFGYVRLRRKETVRVEPELARKVEVPRRAGGGGEEDYEWLDLDIIDCTYLDANVHNLRHCFFNINASVIADLRELITQTNRAAARHKTLERRDGNVYTFRTPPAELSSIFGI